MAWALNDIVRMTFRQTYLEQEILNTLFYKIATDPTIADMDEVLEDVTGQIVVDLVDAQNDGLEHFEQITDDISNGIDFSVSVNLATGQQVSTSPSNSFMAYGLKKSVATKITRPGSIRIAGVRDEGVTDNDLNAAQITVLNTLGDLLEDDRVGADQGLNDVTFEPVVVGRLPDGSFDLTKINPIVQVHLPRLTSQVSRKKGHGT